MPFKSYYNLFKDEDFKIAVSQKRLCLFLGAGVGMNIGMPDWRNFSSETVNFCFKEKLITRSEMQTIVSFNDPLKSISLCTQLLRKKGDSFILKYENGVLKNLFYENPYKKLRKLLEANDNKFDNSVYGILHKLHYQYGVLIVQTNYDVCLESLMVNSEERKYLVPFLDKGATSVIDKYINKDNSHISTPFPIVYLHGRFYPGIYDFSEEYSNLLNFDDLVCDREQYNQVYVLKNEERYMNQSDFIKYLLKNFSIVFLGYSLNDHEIMQMIANREKCEDTKKISVIVDNCKSIRLQNELNSEYISQASNNNISTYFYDTEKKGIIDGFYSVILKLYRVIREAHKTDVSLIEASNPENIADFS